MWRCATRTRIASGAFPGSCASFIAARRWGPSEAYLAFIMDRIAGGQFDVLLPIHEQGLLFAKARARIAAHVAVALPSFESYVRAHNKIGFSQILSELDLPQPMTRVVASAKELAASKRPPMVLKTPVGTASREFGSSRTTQNSNRRLRRSKRSMASATP